MWNCKSCGASIEDDTWDTCWKCSSSKDATPNEVAAVKELIDNSMQCLRCETSMEYAGTKRFHEGSRVGLFGDLAELFVNREKYDVYFCPKCGKVEFFIDGIGDSDRDEDQ